MKSTKPKSTSITVTFNEDAGLYCAEETTAAGLLVSFGQTPEEAMERLDLARAMCADCEECRRAEAAAAAGAPLIDPYCN